MAAIFVRDVLEPLARVREIYGTAEDAGITTDDIVAALVAGGYLDDTDADTTLWDDGGLEIATATAAVAWARASIQTADQATTDWTRMARSQGARAVQRD